MFSQHKSVGNRKGVGATRSSDCPPTVPQGFPDVVTSPAFEVYWNHGRAANVYHATGAANVVPSLLSFCGLFLEGKPACATPDVGLACHPSFHSGRQKMVTNKARCVSGFGMTPCEHEPFEDWDVKRSEGRDDVVVVSLSL